MPRTCTRHRWNGTLGVICILPQFKKLYKPTCIYFYQNFPGSMCAKCGHAYFWPGADGRPRSLVQLSPLCLGFPHEHVLSELQTHRGAWANPPCGTGGVQVARQSGGLRDGPPGAEHTQACRQGSDLPPRTGCATKALGGEEQRAGMLTFRQPSACPVPTLSPEGPVGRVGVQRSTQREAAPADCSPPVGASASSGHQ